MATLYVRSTDGSNVDNGTTWALAKADIAGAAAIDAAGDRIWVSNNHAEITAGAISWAFAGTLTNPVQVLCGDDAAEPPSALATTGTVATSGASRNFSVTGCVYVRGLSISWSGAGTLNAQTSGNETQVYDTCSFNWLGGGSANSFFTAGLVNATHKTVFRNCSFKMDATGERITVMHVAEIWGGSWTAGGTTPASVFQVGTDRTASSLLCTGFDFSALASTVNLVDASAANIAPGRFLFRNCKLPASWSGSLCSTTARVGARYEMVNCDAGDVNYALWVEDGAGSIRHETTIVRTSGASDGTTALSWKMSTSANAKYPTVTLESPEIVQWNDTTGSAKTATIEFVHDTNVAAGQGAGTASAFQDDEVWLQIEYLGTSGFPVSTVANDCKSSVIATAADQTSSSVAWTTTGLTTPVKQKLSVSFTPQEKGPVIARIVMAKASKTIYVCPKLDIS